jgi:hypothetical protein
MINLADDKPWNRFEGQAEKGQKEPKSARLAPPLNPPDLPPPREKV